MKRFIVFLLSLLCVVSMFNCQVNAKEESWYFKKKGNGAPVCGVSNDFLRETNSVWLDTSESGEKVIYLTFDVGYVNENVIKTLDVLKSEGVQGAFFVLGHPILKNTDTIKRMKEDGHLVCNHTKNHKDITTMTQNEFQKNLLDLEMVYEEKTGYSLDRLFRPPEGKYSKEALLWAKELGYQNVFWSYAYADWDEKNATNPEKALKKLTENLHSGEVLLLHPTSSVNAEILGDFIRYCKEKGYQFRLPNAISANIYK